MGIVMEDIVSPNLQILDACAMLAFVRREPGANVVDELLTENNTVCYAHAINVCEVYYDFVRSEGIIKASEVVKDLLVIGMVLQEDLDQEFWKMVGNLKVTPGKLSLADCFALALSLRLGACLVTSDHHEFDAVAASGLVDVKFIRLDSMLKRISSPNTSTI